VLLVVCVVHESDDGWLNLMLYCWFEWVWNKRTYLGFSIKKRWWIETYIHTQGLVLKKRVRKMWQTPWHQSLPTTIFLKCRATHLRVHRSWNKYCIFYTNNCLSLNSLDQHHTLQIL
jgi:hypothetical protein